MNIAQFQNVKKISKGMSGDEKYRVEKDGKAYLLRVADAGEFETKKREYDYLRSLGGAGLPVPGCFGFEKDGEHVYTLLSWIEGEEAEKVLPKMDGNAQHEFGVQAGDILRRIHENSPADISGNWHDRYFEVIEPRLDAFRNEGIPFEGSDKVLAFIEENRHLLKERPMCRHHGDFHMGNLIINGDRLHVIDWHTVDFENTGDPWYEFNRIGTEHPAFARGQVDGYFRNAVPEEFWRLFALYFAASAITSIVWAKYWAPKELDYIMDLNRRVVDMFDNMENPVPKWYRGK